MTQSRRSKVDGDILDEVLKNNGTRTNRNGDLKGLQQYETPPGLAREVVRNLSIHPGQSVYDPQCAHGNLLAAAPHASPKFGVEIDETCEPNVFMAHGATPRFDAVMAELFDPDWRVDFALANPPFGLKWDGADSTEWTLRHCMAHANAGVLIANAGTISRLNLNAHEWAVRYETMEDVWENTDVAVGILYWKNPHPEPPTPYRNLMSKFESAARVLSEDRSGRQWNFWLDHKGRLKTYLSTRLRLKRKIDQATARNLLALDGHTPMSLVGDYKARRVMSEMIREGYYAVEPECQEAIEAAIKEARHAEIPIMDVTDFELVAYAEVDGKLRCRESPGSCATDVVSDESVRRRIEKLKAVSSPGSGATEGEARAADESIRRLSGRTRSWLFTPGKEYAVDSESYEFEEKFQREKVHLEEETLRTYTMSHNCKLSGRERKVIVRDNNGDYHEFLDRPDPKCSRLRNDGRTTHQVFTHPESDLWEIFERPKINTVADQYPDRMRYHNEIMDSMEMCGDFAFKPGQRDYLARFAVKDFGLPAAETGCHAKGTPILTYDGEIKAAEEIKVGDVLQGWDDTPRKVRRLERGRQRMARITPVKGEPFTVNLDHILTLVRTSSGSSRPNESDLGGQIVDVSVRDYLKWNTAKKHVYKLFRRGVDHWPHRVHPYSPYFIGVMLGDGSCNHGQIGISKPDNAIRQAVLSECSRYNWKMRTRYRTEDNPTYFINCRGMLTNWVKDEHLDVRSGDKYIPERYKIDSRENRLEILAGLLDTDGSLADSGAGYDFISKSSALASDVAFIARSLGLSAYVKPCTKHCQGGFSGRYHRVGISGDCSIIPCRIPRKKATPRRQKKDPLRTGFKVAVLEEDNYYGFTIEGDGRYLMGDFTVTHNCGKTLLAIATAAMKGAHRTLIIAPQGTVKDSYDADTGERSIAQWLSEIRRFAPWAEVHTFMNEKELHAHRDRDGHLPKGFYLTYYECLFRNKSREFAPKTWRSKDLYRFLGKDYEPRMLERKNRVTGEIELYDANDHEEWVAGMGECGRLHEGDPHHSEAAGIKCLAVPCLAEKVGDEFDMVVADEAHKACFPPSTKVTTDKGELTIGEIVEKQLDCSVLSYNIKTQLTEWKPVLDWIRIKTNQPLVKVTHESGSFICTADHEIHTGEGKKPAASLRLGEDLRTLPKEILYAKTGEEHGSILLSKMRDPSEKPKADSGETVRPLRGDVHDQSKGQGNAPVLFKDVRKPKDKPKEASASNHKTMSTLRKEFPDHSKEGQGLVQSVMPQGRPQPDEKPALEREDARVASRPDVPREGRQRHANEAAEDTRSHTQLADGSPDTDSQSQRSIREPSPLLQGGPGESKIKARHRSGRTLTQVEEVEVLGQEEDRCLECPRVVSVEVLERGDTERLTEGNGKDRIVYCLEVEDNHNFFTDGALVSNCHLSSQLTDALIRLQPKYRYAFTATPIPNKASNLFSLLGWLCVPGWYKGGQCNAAFPYRREDMGRFCENFLSNERDLTAEDMAEAARKTKPKPKPSPILSSPARLLKLIKPTLAYISKPDCDPEYVRPEIVDVRVPMGRQQSRLYGHFMERGKILHGNHMTKAAVQIAVLRSICAEPMTSKYNGPEAVKHKCAPCPHPVRSPYNPKLQTILSLCRDIFAEGRQAVIVNSRVGLTDCIAARLAQCGVPYSRIDSTVSPDRHAAEAASFKRNDTRVMLMGIKCAQSYSFDQCDRLIVGSLDYSYGSFEQAKGRIDRITSRGVKIFCVLVQSSIEETVFDSVATKQDSAAICLRGKRVPRTFKPVDMNELLAKSFEKFSTENLIDEDEQLKHWPVLRSEITEAFKGNGVRAIA